MPCTPIRARLSGFRLEKTQTKPPCFGMSEEVLFTQFSEQPDGLYVTAPDLQYEACCTPATVELESFVLEQPFEWLDGSPVATVTQPISDPPAIQIELFLPTPPNPRLPTGSVLVGRMTLRFFCGEEETLVSFDVYIPFP